MLHDTDSKYKLSFITKGETMELVCYIRSPDWLRNSFTAHNSFFKTGIEVPAFKAEKHRTILVGRDTDYHLIQHPASSRATASTWSGRPRLGVAKLQIYSEMEVQYLVW